MNEHAAAAAAVLELGFPGIEYQYQVVGGTSSDSEEERKILTQCFLSMSFFSLKVRNFIEEFY